MKFEIGAVVVSILLGCGSRSKPTSTFESAPRERAKGAPGTSICDGKAPWNKFTQDEKPRGLFVLSRHGDLQPPPSDYEDDEIAFQFDDVTVGDEVRLDVLNPNDETARTTLACGPVDPKGTFVPNGSISSGAIVSLEVYGTPNSDETERAGRLLAGARAPLVTTLEPGERDQVRRQVLTPTLMAMLRDVSMGDVQQIDQALLTLRQTAITDLTGLVTTWCDSASTSPLAPATCSEAKKLKPSLETLAAILEDVIRTRKDPTIAAALHPVDMLARVKFVELVAALPVPDPNTLFTLRKQCDGVSLLAWLSSKPGAAPRLLTRARIPWVGSDTLISVNYGQNGDDFTGIDPTERYGFLVLNAPVSKPGSFASHQGNVITSDVSAILLATIRPALNATPLHGVGFDPATAMNTKLGIDALREGPDSALDSKKVLSSDAYADLVGALTLRKKVPTKSTEIVQPAAFSLVCDPPPSAHGAPPAPPVPATVATGIDPIATIESRAFLVGPLPSKYSTDVVACEGTTCSGTTDDKQVRSRRTLLPDQTWRLTLLADVSANVGIHSIGDTAPGSDLGFRGQTSPTFQPVLGAGTSDQVFQLRQESSPQNVFATSLLLGVHLRSCIFGVGPSLLVGGSGSVLTQFSAHGGCPLFPRLAPNVYLVTGFSVRFVPSPDAYQIGALVDAPIPASGTATAPSFASHETGLLQFDLGLAIDIGGLGATLSSTISSLGGGK